MIKIYKFIVNVIFVIVIAFLLVYLMFRVTDKIEIYKVKTGSMEEKIHVGDYILIYRKDSYNVGEIVTYTSNDGFITHRIISKNGNKIITKGDANNAEDREIVESTIVGKVIISGGILNVLINYKYVIVCLLLSLYLFSCYFGNGNKHEKNEQDSTIDSDEDKENSTTLKVEESAEINKTSEEKDKVKVEEDMKKDDEVKVEENTEKEVEKVDKKSEEKTEIDENKKEEKIENNKDDKIKLEKDNKVEKKSETKEVA